MRTFKYAKPALAAAAGRPYLTVRANGQLLYIVFDPADAVDEADFKRVEVNFCAPVGKPVHGTRGPATYLTTGHITLNHLDRLDNANHATPGSRQGLHWPSAFGHRTAVK